MKFVQMKGYTLFQGEIIIKLGNTLTKSSSPAPLGQFQLTLTHCSLVWRGFNFKQIRTIQFSKRRLYLSSLLIKVMRKCVYWLELFFQVSDFAHGPLVKGRQYHLFYFISSNKVMMWIEEEDEDPDFLKDPTYQIDL